MREKYNRLKGAGLRGLVEAGYSSFRSLPFDSLAGDGGAAAAVFEHVARESVRVERAVETLRLGDLEAFGKLLLASHASLRDQLGVSTPAINGPGYCGDGCGRS